MPGSFRMWRWLSATGARRRRSRHGRVGRRSAGSTAIAHATPWRGAGPRAVIASAPVPHQPRPFPHCAPAARGRPVVRGGVHQLVGPDRDRDRPSPAVTGNWVVPTVQPTQYSGASATWIGIDGGPNSPNSIIQTGTAQVTNGGVTAYYAWYELYPDTGGHPSAGLARRPDAGLHHQERRGQLELLTITDVTYRDERCVRDPHLRRSRRLRRVDRGAARRRWAPHSPPWPTSARRRSPT